MRKLIILGDMDGMTTDLIKKLLYRYNNDHGTEYSHKDITTWNFSKCLPNGKKVFEYMNEPGFFRDLEPIEGAVEELYELHKDGHDLHILSTPFIQVKREDGTFLKIHGTCAHDKLEWVEQHLPFIGAEKTNLVRSKAMVFGDVLLDDKPSTIEKYRARWPNAHLATIAYEYNKHSEPLLNTYAPSYKNFRGAWAHIRREIQELAAK